MKRIFKPTMILTAALSIFVTGCTTTVRQHPEFEARRSQVHTVAFIRPKAEIVLIKFKGDNESLTDTEKFVCSTMRGLVSQHLIEQGFEVVNNNSTEQNLTSNSDFSFKATELAKSCESLANEMWKQLLIDKKKALKWKGNLGPEVNIFSDYYKSDLLVFMCMTGYEKDKDERKKDFVQALMVAFLSGGNYQLITHGSNMAAYVILVDGTDGHMLWANMAIYPEIKFNEKHLKKLAKLLFKEFPQILDKKESI